MRLSIIVARADNGVIGRQGQLPWRLPADLRRFRRLTMGHHVIMGRKTHESLPGPLPGRTMIVISGGLDQAPPGSLLARSLDEACALARGDDEVFVIGGEEIYRLALPRADRLYLTAVHGQVAGDTCFPELDPRSWTLVEESFHPADEKHELPYSFRTYERARSPGTAAAD
jgi:dihydrofolate reductase